MKYTRTAIGLLTAQYRSVLRKCWLINVGLFALGAAAVAPSGAMASDGWFENANLQWSQSKGRSGAYGWIADSSYMVDGYHLADNLDGQFSGSDDPYVWDDRTTAVYVHIKGAGGRSATVYDSSDPSDTSDNDYFILGNFIADVNYSLNWLKNNALFSHQSLAGYATQSWVQSQGYITAAQAPQPNNSTINIQINDESATFSLNQSNGADFNFSQVATKASVTSEANTRSSADTTLQANIDAEATARATAVSTEATARSNADAAILNGTTQFTNININGKTANAIDQSKAYYTTTDGKDTTLASTATVGKSIANLLGANNTWGGTTNTFSNNVVVNGNTTLGNQSGDTLNVTGTSSFTGNVGVTGAVTASSNITSSGGNISATTGNVSAGGIVSAGTDISAGRNLTVTGTAAIGGATAISGDLSVKNGTNVMMSVAHATGNIDTAGTLNVKGNSTLGDDPASDSVTIKGKSYLKNDLEVHTGNTKKMSVASASGNIWTAGSITADTDATVKGNTILGTNDRGDTVTIWGNTTVNNDMTFKNGSGAQTAKISYSTGNIETPGDLNVKGNTTLGDTPASDTLTVNAKTYINGSEIALGDASSDVLTVNANTIFKDNIRSDNAKAFTMYTGVNTTPQIQLNSGSGDQFGIKVYDSGGHVPVAEMKRSDGANGMINLSRWEGSGTNQTTIVDLRSSTNGGQLSLNNAYGKNGIIMTNSNTGNNPQGTLSMYAGGSNTANPTLMSELKSTNTGGEFKLTDGTNLKNEQTKKSITLTNSSNKQSVNILTEDDNTGTIVVKNASGTPVNTLNKDGITIADSKMLFMGTTDYADDSGSSGDIPNPNLRNKITFNGRLIDTFSGSDNLYLSTQAADSKYGDVNTIASTKTVANALGNLRDLQTNYLFDTEFGRDGNTVAENLKRLDSKISTWTDHYKNITTSKAVTDAGDSAGSFTATPTIGETFEAIDKAIGTVANGNYVSSYNGTTYTNIAANINKLDTQLASTYSGMLTNRDNLATLRSEVGYRNNIDITNKNLTYGTSSAPSNIVAALNNMSYTVGKIHGLANSDGTVNSTDVASTVGNRTNLTYNAKTVSGQLVALDNAIDRAKTRIGNTETAIGNIANLGTGHYVYNAGNLTTAILNLDGQVYTNANRIGNLNNLTGNAAGKGNLVAAVNAVDGAVAREVTRAQEAETTLETAIGTERTRATTAENNLRTSITNEVSRAKGVEGNLDYLQVTIAEGLDKNLVNAINSLKGTVDNLDTEIQNTGTDIGDLSDLTHRAISDKSKVTKAINSLATNVATGMGGSFNNNGRWSGTASTYLGQKTVYNIMNAVQHVSDAIGTVADFGETPANGLSAGNTVNQNLTALSSALSAETRRATRAETTLNADIQYEAERATTAESTLQTAIGNEVTRARGVEGTLSNLRGHATGAANLVAAINAVDQATYDENTRALDAEATLRAGLTAEVTRATSAEETNATNIANEVTRATQAETTISNNLSTLTATVGNLGNITQNAVSSKSSVTNAINSLAGNVSRGLGGSFNGDGVWSGSIQTYKDTTPYGVSSVMGAVTHVSDVIGTVAELGYTATSTPKNGLSRNNTVNANLAALNTAVGDVGIFKSNTYNYLAKNANDVVDAITKIDSYVSTIGDGTGDLSALTHPAISVSQRSKITTAVNSLATNVATGMGGEFALGSGAWSDTIQTYKDTTAVPVTSIMQAVKYIAGANVIGTAAELGTETNGVKSSNTINANIGAINGKLGDVGAFIADNYSGAAKNATTAVNAIKAVDQALSDETTRATVAEENLQNSINTVDTKVTTVTTNLTNLTGKVTNMGVGMGGSLTDGGVWSGTVQTYKDASPVAVDSIMEAVQYVAGENVIGTAAELGTANGVSANYTINKNIGMLSSALTAEKTRATNRENQINTALGNEATRAQAAEAELTSSVNVVKGNVTTLTNNVNNLSTRMEKIGTGLGGSFDEEGDWSGSVQTYKDAEPVAVSTVMGAVNHVVDVIGTAAELGTANGVSANYTVNKNIGALSTALTNEITRATNKETTLNNSLNTVKSSVTTLTNNVDNLTTKVTNIGTGLGGELSSAGVWSGSMQTYKDASAIEYDGVFDAVLHIKDVIGTANELGTANGVSASYTVNKNIGMLSSALTTAKNESVARDETLQTNINTVNNSVTTLGSTVNNLSTTVDTLDTAVTNMGETVNTLNSNVTNLSGWVGTGPFNHNAISDKSSVTGAVNSLAANVAKGMGGLFDSTGSWSATILDNSTIHYGQINGATAITGVLSQVVSNIGTRADLGYAGDTAPKNGLKDTYSVNKNLATLNSAIGDLNTFTASDLSDAVRNKTNVVDAVAALDRHVQNIAIDAGAGDISALSARIEGEITRSTTIDNDMQIEINGLGDRIGEWPSPRNNAITNVTSVTNAIESLADNIETATGGTFQEDGSWKGSVTAYKVAQESDAAAPKDFTTVMGAINYVSDVIGDAEDLGYGTDPQTSEPITPANNVSKTKTVNENIAALNAALVSVQDGYATKAEVHGVDGTTGDIVNIGELADKTNIGTATTGIKIDTTNDGKKIEVVADTIKLGSKVTVNNTDGSTVFGTGSDIVTVQNGAIEATGNVKAGGLVLTNNTSIPVTKVDGGAAPITSGAADTMATTATVFATVGNMTNLNTGNFAGSGNTVENKLSTLNSKIGNVAGITVDVGDAEKNVVNAINKLNTLTTTSGTDITHIKVALGNTFDATSGEWGDTLQTYKDANPVEFTDVMSAIKYVAGENVIGTAAELGSSANGVLTSNTINANIGALNSALSNVKQDLSDKYALKTEVRGDNSTSSVDTVRIGDQADKTQIGTATTGISLDDTASGKKIELTANTIQLGDQITISKTGGSTTFSGDVSVGGKMTLSSDSTDGGLSFGNDTTVATSIVNTIGNGSANALATSQAVKNYVGTADLTLNINGEAAGTFNANASEPVTIDLGSYVTQETATPSAQVKTSNNTIIIDADANVGSNLKKMADVVKNNANTIAAAVDTAAKIDINTGGTYTNDGKLITSGAVRNYVKNLDEAVVHLAGPEDITGTKTFKAAQNFEKISGDKTYTTIIDGKTLTMKNGNDAKITMDAQSGNASIGGTLAVAGLATLSGGAAVANGQSLTVGNGAAESTAATFNLNGTQAVSQIVNEVTSTDENVLKSQLVTAKAVKDVVDSIAVEDGDRVIVSDSQRKMVSSGISTTELNQLSGINTDKTIQAQLDEKMNTADWTTTVSEVQYIRGDKIAAKSIDSTQLNDDAVTTAKILNENVTLAKLEQDVQTSLGKADTALQNVKINGTALDKVDNAVDIAVVVDADKIEKQEGDPSEYVNDGKLISSGAVREYVTGIASNKVSKTGDTMSGALTITNGAATEVSLTTSGYIAATGGVKFDSEERIMKGTYTGDLSLGTAGDGGNEYTLVTTKALASTLYNEAKNGGYSFGDGADKYITNVNTTIGDAITRLNRGLKTVSNNALTTVIVNGDELSGNAVNITIAPGSASGTISVNDHDVAVTNVVTTNTEQNIEATKTFTAKQKFTKSEQQTIDEQEVTVNYETDIDGKTLKIGQVSGSAVDAAITLNGADGSSVFDGHMQVDGGINTTTLGTTGAITSGGLITANAGVNTTTLTASDMITANKGITVKDGEKFIFDNAELTTVLTGTAALTDDDDTIASSRVIKKAITDATYHMATTDWVLGDTGAQLANFTVSGDENILAGSTRNIGAAINYLGQQTYTIKNKFGTDDELGYDDSDPLHPIIPANNVSKTNSVNANIKALNDAIGDVTQLNVTLAEGVDKNVVNAINKVNYDLQNASGYMSGYVTQAEVHGGTGHENIVFGDVANTTTIGTATTGIKIDTVEEHNSIDIKAGTINLGTGVTVDNEEGLTTFGTGNNTVSVQNGAIEATGNTTTGGLIVKNGTGGDAYTSQTITRIDASSTDPLAAGDGSSTTLATTQTVSRTVGNVVGLIDGNFQGTGGTVADKLSKLNDVIGSTTLLGEDASKGISTRNKLTNAIASLAENVSGGMGGSFDAGTGAWSSSIQTYKDATPYGVTSIMGAVTHLNDVIGTVADLGYDNTDPEHPITPKNGLSKGNTINQNLAALNTVIGDMSVFSTAAGYTGKAKDAADVAHAIAQIDTALGEEILRAQGVEGNINALDPDLDLGDNKTLVNAINKINQTVKSIDGDFVTQSEIHGDTDHKNIVFGESAETTTIGTATTGIKVDTTNDGKKVEVKADTITLGSAVTVNSDGSTTFGSGNNTVEINNGAIEAKGNVKTSGLVLTNNTTAISQVDLGTAPITSGATNTMATTATVYATVGDVAGLTDGNFTGSGNTVEAKLSALNTAVGDVSGLTDGNFAGSGDHVVNKLEALDDAIGDKSALGNDASNGISDKSDVTHAIASLAENVGDGLGGEFNATTGKWGGSVQTYKDTSPVGVTSVMGAVNHVSDVIGTVADLGYDDSDPENPITPKNGVDMGNTVNANIAAVNAAVGDTSTLAGTWGQDETKNVVNAINKVNQLVVDANSDISDVKDSFGGNGFDGTTGKWSANVSTYRSTITVNKMMDAVQHISNTIGTADDLGYTVDPDNPEQQIAPKNGLLKSNTVNANIAALNTVIGDTSALTVDLGSEDRNVVNAVNKVNSLVGQANTDISNIKSSFGGTFDDTTGVWTASVSTYYKTDNNVHTVVDAVKVASDTIGTAGQLTTGTQTALSASQTVNQNLRALKNALDAAEQSFSSDFVTKPEIHGDNDPTTTDTVIIGDQAARTTIGTATTGVVVDTTDSGSGTRVDVKGDKINLGTTVEVNDQSGVVTFRGDNNSVVIDNGNISAAGISIGGNPVTGIDTGTPITPANASSSTLATTATVAATVINTMGGEIDEEGKWSANVTTYLGTISAESFLQAINHVGNTTIGTDVDLGSGMNGVSKTQTVNANIGAINSTLGDLRELARDLGNLTNGQGGDYRPQNTVEVFNNIDSTMGRIHGLVNADGTVNGTHITSSVGKGTNLAAGVSVEDHLVSLDNAIGNRAYTSTNIVAKNSSMAAAISALDKSIGSASDLGQNPANGVKAGNSVNANIAAVNTALGDVSQLKNTYLLSEAVSMTDAVRNLDAQIYGMGAVVNQVAHQLSDMRKEMRGGFASAAALSALVPNSRSAGKTSLALGLGGYKGTQGVAVGGFHYFTDNLLFNVGASLGVDSEAMYRVGMTYTF